MRFLNGFGLISIVFTILFSAVATAQPLTNIYNAIEWIEKETDYVYNFEPLVFVSMRQPTETLREGDVIGTVKRTSNDEWAILYHYAARENVVFHELIHVIQFINGKTPENTCIGLLEEEAYRLEAKWMKEHNINAPVLDKFDRMQMIASCAMGRESIYD